MTNNLNFGNPEKPHIAWQLTEAVRGLGDACRALDVPVTGGNVSLYNEGADRPDLPDAGHRHGRPPARRARAPGRLGFAREGDAIALAGWDGAPSLAGGELAKLRGEPLPDGLPAVDLARARAVLEAVRDAVRAGTLSSCHDVAEGGLLVARRRVLPGRRPGRLARPRVERRPLERALRRAPRRLRRSRARATRSTRWRGPCPSTSFGTVGGDALELTIAGETSRWALAELREAHGALGRFFP